MKTNLEPRLNRRDRILATTALALVAPALVIAAVLPTSELDVGMTNNNPTYRSAVVGRNSSASYSSLSVGGSNTVHDDSLAAGHSNDVRKLSAAVGYYNDVNLGGTGEYPRYGMAIGLMNAVYGNSAFAAGESNNIQADNAAALGHGLTSTADDATVVGSYNVDKAGLRFAVGTGTGPTANERANALEVYANGDIIMKKQGDISMGVFDDIP